MVEVLNIANTTDGFRWSPEDAYTYPSNHSRIDPPPYPHLKLDTIALLDTFDGINNNPKLRLHVYETTKIRHERNRINPAKEKFIPGFAHYDAPVGLPDSPVLKASGLVSPVESLSLSASASSVGDYWSEEVHAEMLGLTQTPTGQKHSPHTSSSFRDSATPPLHDAAYALQKSPTPPPTSGLSHSEQQILRLQIRSSFSAFFRDFTPASIASAQKCLIYTLSTNHRLIVPWTAKIENQFRSLWKLCLKYDAMNGSSPPLTMLMRRKERVSYRTVALGLLCSELGSEALCRIWDRSLCYVEPARQKEDFAVGWLSFTEFVAVVWGAGLG